ncbi:conjugal transfer protein MobC [Sphingobacterium sp. UBA5670]|uniref:conjugal transfer protein MobC n=1 Tax=Sphingobacterium sp. UBA5670 TaxID=1947502 RepID=UPI0025F12959|nr:conjugal transfer protein MobC [Sphingobacterium sp. UBA5670]
MSTGENEQALRKIIDMTRWIAIIILLLHFYYYLYQYFSSIGLSGSFTDKILNIILKAGLFSSFHKSKLIALFFLVLSLVGVKGKKSEKIQDKLVATYIFTGLLLYFIGYFLFKLYLPLGLLTWAYISITFVGIILLITGGTYLSRIIRDALSDDIFNEENETFPQEERLIENEFSINLPAIYQLKNKKRRSWINVISPQRGLLVLGTPGAGKSYFAIRHVITQHIRKGFTMFVYDFKMPDLSIIAYNTWLKNKDKYGEKSQCFFINFDDLSRSHRCNPLDPLGMNDITDAAESARTILLGLNRQWQTKQGDFFIESPINFLTALIWFLRKYQDGEFCTLPHVLELLQVPYDKLFSVLRTESEIEVLINPFINAFQNGAMEQLEGQIGSAKIALARLSSPQLYYVLSGNDFTLDINDPDHPKIVCMGNNPKKIQIYGAVLSLFVNRLIKIVNEKGKLKSSLIFDEFPTIYLNRMDSLIATARSNKVSTTLGIQDLSQLRMDYGKEQADVIIGIVGNIISGQVTGDTAKLLSERIGRIMQDRQSLSINRNDTSISKSKQLEAAVPASKIASLSSGEFVGMVADTPDQKIALKAFHCEIQNDHEELKREEDGYKPIPIISKVEQELVIKIYSMIREEIKNIIDIEIQKLI